MATQSERLGYELAKWLGVQTPQVVLYILSNTTTNLLALSNKLYFYHIHSPLLFGSRLESFTILVQSGTK